jgi:HD-like signal output (HDOD) protein
VLERSRTGLAEFDYGSFWSESLARAVAARILASWTKQIPADEAFTYGLLSNIGRLALVSARPRQYREMLLTLGRVDATELAEAERAVFEVDAETLSALMLKSWGLPSLHDAMGNGQEPDTAAAKSDRTLLMTCRAAACMAQVLVATAVTRDQLAAAMHAMGEIGIGNEVVAHLFPDVVATLHETGATLQIETRSVGSLAELYAHATDAP